jgi:hypothetical protein
MNAVIIYDDFDIAVKAKATLERAARRADGALAWTVEPWRLDLLSLPPAMDAALTDAAHAHLIVLGLLHPRLLPAWLLDWLEQWAMRRQVPDAALALFDGGNGATLSATSGPELSQFAERHSLSFILGDVGPTEDGCAAFARSLPQRGVFVTPTRQRIMAEPARNFSRDWGINE